MTPHADEKLKNENRKDEIIKILSDMSKEEKPNGRLTEDQVKLLCSLRKELADLLQKPLN